MSDYSPTTGDVMKNAKYKNSELDLRTLEFQLIDQQNDTERTVHSLAPTVSIKYEKEILKEEQQNLLQSSQAEFPLDFTLDVEEDDVQAPSDNTAKKQQIPVLWMLLALLSHTGWGIYPVLARYLQTVTHLPSMSLLITGNGVVAIITLVIVIKRGKFMQIIAMNGIVLMALVSVLRSSTNLLSPRFTMAVYVQLMTLMTPFMVALMSNCLMQEQLPPFTFPSLVACTVGAVMMLLSNVFPFQLSITGTDVIGIGLALLSALFLAIYMILVKKSMSANKVQGEELLFFLTSPIVIVAGAFSILLEEDWSPWLDLDLTGWIVWTGFAFGILLFGNLLQISSIRVLGAPMVSTLLSFRLVSSLIFSKLIMKEELTDVYQFIGAFIVLTSITLFLWKQTKKK